MLGLGSICLGSMLGRHTTVTHPGACTIFKLTMIPLTKNWAENSAYHRQNFNLGIFLTTNLTDLLLICGDVVNRCKKLVIFDILGSILECPVPLGSVHLQQTLDQVSQLGREMIRKLHLSTDSKNMVTNK